MSRHSRTPKDSQYGEQKIKTGNAKEESYPARKMEDTNHLDNWAHRKTKVAASSLLGSLFWGHWLHRQTQTRRVPRVP